MTTKYPRLQCHVQPATMARINELKRLEQRQAGAVVDDAIANYMVDRKSWVAHQAGYQTLLGTAVMLALARKTLSKDELSEARKTAEQAAVLLFGPLGKRPFDVDVSPPTDERLLALFEALS
jgi:hypothetical protein